jgi:hypothetical protein
MASVLTSACKVIRYASDAIDISRTSSKAYFRRAAAQEAKKDFDKVTARTRTSALATWHPPPLNLLHS